MDATVEPDATVTLREVTAENWRAVCNLTVAPSQESFVAPNVWSIAEAHFSDAAWYRAIYAGETPVGFLMLEDTADSPARAAGEPPSYYLWRFMIAAGHQGKGFGRRALELLIAHVRTRPGATDLLVGYVPGDGCPAGFYRTLGFAETGEVDGGEVVMRLLLALVDGNGDGP